jgi:hypothetical protein
MVSSGVFVDNTPVEVRADWQREVAGFKVLLRRERGGYRLEVWRDLEEVKSWSVADGPTAEKALEELRELLLEKVEPEAAEGAEKLLEELRGRFKRGTPPLVLVGPFGRLEIAASDGAVLRAAMLYMRRGEVEWMGELTYAVGTLTPPEEEEGKGKRRAKPRAGLFPLLALAKAEKGVVVERRVVPLLEPVIDLDGVAVPLDFKAQLNERLETLMEVETITEWLNGGGADLRGIHPKLVERMKRFANFSWDPRLYHVAACYAEATYFAQVFPAFPQLHFVGSVDSGKTRAAKTVVYASRRGLAATFASEASVFRLAENVGATLLIDDVWGPGAKITHLSYKRGLKVLRVEKGVGERLTLTLYETYCPLVFTGVELPSSEHLLSRAIIVKMQRAPDPNPAGKDPEPEDFKDIRRGLYLAALTQFPEVRRAYEELAGRRRELGLEGRSFEIWAPLLAVAKIAGEEVFEAVLSYALENTGSKLVDLYEEEKEVLAGLERLLLSRAEELFRGELEKLWKGEEESWEVYREKLASVAAELEKGVTFSAADLLRAMKEVLVRGEGEEASEEKPYTEKQFESRWTPQRLGRFLGSRLEGTAPFERKTKRKQQRRVTLSSFLKAAERYGYEPDERLLKLATMGDKMVSVKDLNATYATRTSESETLQQGGSVSAIDTSVESLSANGKMASSQGDKGVVSGGVTAGGGETPSPPGEFAILPPSEKRADKPFLAETVQPSKQKNEGGEPGTPGGKSGKLGEPHMPSYHRGSGKLEEIEGEPPPPPASAGEPRRNGETGEMEKAENEEACPYWNGEYCEAAGYASFRSEVLEKGRRPPCLGGSDKCPWGAWRLNALRKKRREEEMAEEAAEVWGG